MALVKCTECGYSISDEASACVHCGCPMSVIIAARKAQRERRAMEDFYIVGDTLIKYKGNDSEVVLPGNIKVIGRQAFGLRGNLKKVVIPNGVLSIGDAAFDSCFSLREVVIPNSVIEIEKSAFASCVNLENIVIPNGVEIIAYKTFFNCRSLKNIVIPDSVISIGEQAFCNCKNITEIVIPSSVKAIGESAFFGCTALKTVKLGRKIVSIEWNTFSGCTALEEIELSDSVRNICYGAFDECSAIKNVYYGGSQSDWKLVAVNYIKNSYFKAAKLHFSSSMTPPEKKSIPAAAVAPKAENNAPKEKPEQIKLPIIKPVKLTKEEFYQKFIDMIPDDIRSEQKEKSLSLTDDLFDTLSEGLFLIPASDAYKFGCMCLLIKNYKWAFTAFLSAAGKGNALSQYYVGYCFLHGIDTTKKLADAGRWLDKCKNDETIAQDVAEALTILDEELEKPENSGMRAKRKK